MKKITKTDMARLDDLAGKLANKRDEIREAFEHIEEVLVADAEEIKKEIVGVIEDLESTAQDYYDERSEKWQEGDAATMYQDWINHFEGVRTCFEEEIIFPDVTEMLEPIETALTTLNEELQSEPTS